MMTAYSFDHIKKLSGVGFRPLHFEDLKNHKLPLSWIEVISENYMEVSGARLENLLELGQSYDISLHGVSLNLASADPIDKKYLKLLKDLILKTRPIRISDHLCWTGSGQQNFHDLLPFPYNREMLTYIKEKVHYVQDILGQKIVIENLSAYMSFETSTMSEYEFLCELSHSTGCKILFDINNLYVNAVNHHFDPLPIIQSIDMDLIEEVHLAGHTQGKHFIIDTHAETVAEGVWKLFKTFYQRQNHIPFCLEWDSNIPEFPLFFNEMKKAQNILKEISYV